ncbi:MAG TPA: ABC transporter permease [Ilumatobacter sp.]|nr:ABC transporter permease [Ilumatobacter sp.]
MSRRPDTALHTVHAPWGVIIRSFAFVRKEVVEIVRQPRLIALLVLGPFALLLLFGAGYAQNVVVKKALFVGPEDSIYEELHDSYEGELEEFISSEGMVSSEDEARAQLADGKVDIVVVFPPDPQQSVLAGERAVITVLHDEIDPIQEAAIQFAAELAIHEVNSAILTTLAADAQSQLGPVAELSASLQQASDSLHADPVGTREALSPQLAAIDDALAGSENIIARLGVEDPELVARVDAARVQADDIVNQLGQVDENTSDEELDALAASMDGLATALQQSVMLDPEVIVQPFESDAENVVSNSITPTDYFTPSSIALLLQHLALTFAALSIVRDRRTGLFELMRVGPLSSIEIIVGKTFAYLLVGCVVGAALLAASALALGVPLAGSLGYLAVVVVGVLLSSLALGMLFAILSQTESQAVQYAMLALLAGLFFSGFILPIEGLKYPIKAISYLLPVTYGIAGLQDIMLRGRDPSAAMLAGLGALVLGYGVLAVIGLRRRLRTSSE